MKNRTYIKNLHPHVGKEVHIAGWVDARRDHGKLIFLDVRDATGVVQVVATPKEKAPYQEADRVRAEWVVEIEGVVNKRPATMVNPDIKTGDLEISVENITILSQAKELPFEKEAELNLDTYLDNLPLVLRSQRARDIFTIQGALVQAFRESMLKAHFKEYANPILVGSDGEGGAAAFEVNYYKDRQALLATSPQLYKQTMVGVFERVFTTTKAFRAEKHATARHLSEVTQMDFELGFIQSHEDVMDMLEYSTRHIVNTVARRYPKILERFGVTMPQVDQSFPRVTLREAQELLEKEYGITCIGEPDLEPEHERKLSEWARVQKGSDFMFVTHFPTEKRPFYTFIDEEDPTSTKSFDLLFRGLEINSGSQRVHDYDELVERIKAKNLNPDVFSFYLQAFKYGMPPHGGCSTGLERLTARFLDLPNVKEATLFPRDINRIDIRLSES